MKQTALLIEFLIIGTIGLVVLVLLYMTLFNISEISAIEKVKDFKEIIIPIGTFLVYIIGAIVHRTSGLIGYDNFIKVAKKLKLEYQLKKDEDFINKYLLVYQKGSDNVVERVFYNESMLRLFKSSTILFILLGILYFVWAVRLSKDLWIGSFVLVFRQLKFS